jgi:hypothetical protein
MRSLNGIAASSILSPDRKRREELLTFQALPQQDQEDQAHPRLYTNAGKQERSSVNHNSAATFSSIWASVGFSRSNNISPGYNAVVLSGLCIWTSRLLTQQEEAANETKIPDLGRLPVQHRGRGYRRNT